MVFLAYALLMVGGCQSWQYRDLESLPPTAALPQTSQPGVVHAFYWEDVTGSKVEALIALDTYPDNPDEIIELDSLSGPSARGDNYGTLVKGFIEAPVSGEYRFFVSGDDETEFWLSPSKDPAEATLVATVPGWTYQNQFDKYSSQASSFQTLVAGQRYYFEIRHKESTGGDSYSVAWEGPGIAQEIISSDYLRSIATGPDLGIKEAYSLGYRVGFLDAREGLSFNTTYPPLDEDADGLYDNWEIVHGLDPANPADATTDPDNDLLSATDEFLLGTSENNPDTDGDGIPDGAEFAYGLNPLDPADASADRDNDGFTNLEEYLANTAITDPTDKPEQNPVYLIGFTGQYFEGMTFDRFITLKIDESIDFDWGSGSPMPAVPSDRFSVRWVGWFTAPHSTGTREYRFTATTDDGVRLYLGNELIIDDWSEHSSTEFSASTSLGAGQVIPVAMEFFESSGAAVAKLGITDLSTNSSLATANTVRTIDPTVSHSTDTDSDGIPDTWELKFGLNPVVSSASDAVNSMGVTNLEAYEQGLNPWTLEPIAGSESSAGAPATGVTAGEPVTLSWTAPLTRMDGTSLSLSEINYYVINYGQDPDQLSETQRVDGAETSYTFEGLSPGTWYFTIQVVDNDGVSSPESEPVSTVVE
jgi:hypothetical protein